MDFDLTEDQREIKNVARELLAARSPFAKVREAAEAAAYDDVLWREIVGLGWPGIAVAEEHGGQGQDAVQDDDGDREVALRRHGREQFVGRFEAGHGRVIAGRADEHWAVRHTQVTCRG